MHARAPVAIIDIGSNSVRLVVYSGATRIPTVIFNEKVMAGLGSEMGETGALGADAQERALRALDRFRLLTQQMGVIRTRTVATAAVREASNGAVFLDAVRGLGLDPRILAGKEEARMAALGVVSAIPDADGLVGDLGGGSLELAMVAKRKAKRAASLPFGVLRLDALAAEGESAFTRKIDKAVGSAGFAGKGEGKPLYLVGGSWRALAQFDMALADHPLPITHQHAMLPGRPAKLADALRKLGTEGLREFAPVSSSRIPSLPMANRLLVTLVDILRPAALVVSSFGIREGLLFDELDPAQRSRDPLIEAAREAGAGLGRFVQHGDLLDAWIAPAFDDGPRQSRLRLAACLLSDIAWAAHPDFRAERGIDMALHGNWVAIDAPGRVMLALALFRAFGGERDLPYPAIAGLCTREELARAGLWGLAMRLGQRFSGGVSAGLERSRLVREGPSLRLEVRRTDAGLIGESVERRLRSFAGELGLEAEIRVRG